MFCQPITATGRSVTIRLFNLWFFHKKISNSISRTINFYLHFYETNKIYPPKSIRRIDLTLNTQSPKIFLVSYLFKLNIIDAIKWFVNVCKLTATLVVKSIENKRIAIVDSSALNRFLELLTFLPSSSCDPCAKTLSTLAGSEKVMNPNPLQ